MPLVQGFSSQPMLDVAPTQTFTSTKIHNWQHKKDALLDGFRKEKEDFIAADNDLLLCFPDDSNDLGMVGVELDVEKFSDKLFEEHDSDEDENDELDWWQNSDFNVEAVVVSLLDENDVENENDEMDLTNVIMAFGDCINKYEASEDDSDDDDEYDSDFKVDDDADDENDDCEVVNSSEVCDLAKCNEGFDLQGGDELGE